MTDVLRHNRRAWDRQVALGNEWTIPVTSEQVSRARQGDWSIVLTPTKAVPRDWFPPLQGARVLGLASGGGQQGPILAAAGAKVTILDNSPAQLERDRSVARRDGLALEAVQGDMRDLSAFADGSFDLIVHPVSNSFVPDVLPVWREAHRVLRRGGVLLAGFCNPVLFTTDYALEKQGIAQMRYAIPYSDLTSLTPEERRAFVGDEEPLAFGHTLDDQLGGQLAAGFVLTGFFEDRWREDRSPINRYLPCFIATRAVKPGAP